jgi:crossover junction endodeoxyribonuclease RuvC
MRILGIDPGLSGGLCILDTERDTVDVFDIPTRGEEKQREVDGLVVLRWITRGGIIHRAVVEGVGARPGEYVGAAFRFGMAYGALRGIVRSLDIPLATVTPQVWKKFFSLKGPDKEQSRLLAIRMYPGAEAALKRKKDHGRAEAILIANFGLRCQEAMFPGHAVLR